MIPSLEAEIVLTNKSAFKVAQFLESIVGSNYKAKKLLSGNVLVEVYTKDQSDKFLNQTTCHHKIVVSVHFALISSQGVISEIELLNETEENLGSLHDRGLTAVANHHEMRWRRYRDQTYYPDP